MPYSPDSLVGRAEKRVSMFVNAVNHADKHMQSAFRYFSTDPTDENQKQVRDNMKVFKKAKAELSEARKELALAREVTTELEPGTPEYEAAQNQM